MRRRPRLAAYLAGRPGRVWYAMAPGRALPGRAATLERLRLDRQFQGARPASAPPPPRTAWPAKSLRSGPVATPGLS
jgi:hypothetical protein